MPAPARPDRLVAAAARIAADPASPQCYGDDPQCLALAVLVPLAAAGWERTRARRWLVKAHPGLAPVTEHLTRLGPEAAACWTDAMWHRAVALARPDVEALGERIEASWWEAALRPAPGRSGQVDRAVLLAVLDEASRCRTVDVLLSVDEMVVRTGRSEPAVARALRRLSSGSNPPLLLVRRRPGHPNRWRPRLVAAPPERSAPNRPDDSVGSTAADGRGPGEGPASPLLKERVCVGTIDARNAVLAGTGQDVIPLCWAVAFEPGPAAGVLRHAVGHDAFMLGAAGPAAHHLLCLLATGDPAEAGALAQRCGSAPPWVRRTLKALASTGIVARHEDRWRLLAEDPAVLAEGLEALAAEAGTVGMAADRAERRVEAVEVRRAQVASHARRLSDERALDNAASGFQVATLPWTGSREQRRGRTEALPGVLVAVAEAALRASRRADRAGPWDDADVAWVARRLALRLDWPAGWEATREWVVEQSG